MQTTWLKPALNLLVNMLPLNPPSQVMVAECVALACSFGNRSERIMCQIDDGVVCTLAAYIVADCVGM